MADLPISSAAALTHSTIASGDLFPVLDISASSGSKGSKITLTELATAVNTTLLGQASIFTVNGSASTPAIVLSGTPYVGTGTTSFPLFYLNQSTATASTTLNTAGTFFGINSHGTQDLVNWMVDGVSLFKTDYQGMTTIGSSALVNVVLSLKTAYTTVNFSTTGAGDLRLQTNNLVLPENGFLRFGYIGGTDPILTASASLLTLSQGNFNAPAYQVGGVAGVSGTITAASTVTVVNGIITNIA